LKIKNIYARKIVNSAGSYTLETTLKLDGGFVGVASIPAGISYGSSEAVIVKAEDAVLNINEILAKDLIGFEVAELKDLDRELLFIDGTPDKAKFGANAILSVSIACLRALAQSHQLPLYRYIDTLFNKEITNQNFKMPKMMVLMFEGGKHGSGRLKMQEFMQIFDTVDEAVNSSKRLEVYLEENGQSINVGKEGAFCPDLTDKQALDVLVKISKNPIALDVAFTHKETKSESLESLVEKYPIQTVEDPYGEEEWREWVEFTKKYSDRVTVIADDLSVTNVKRLARIVKEKSATGVIVKPNQIGTVSETLDFAREAKRNNMKIVVSHRGIETNDDFIADLAVGIQADYTKFGAVRRGERVAKYNRLLEIQSQIS